ncbi:RIKEN cDNA 1700012H17, isoform CRA_b, partial [Mus musculus]
NTHCLLGLKLLGLTGVISGPPACCTAKKKLQRNTGTSLWRRIRQEKIGEQDHNHAWCKIPRCLLLDSMLWRRRAPLDWLVIAPGTVTPEATVEPTCLIVDSM